MLLSFMRKWRRWHMVFEHLWIPAESSVGLCHLEARLPCEFSVSSSCLRCTPPNPLCSGCSLQQPVIVLPSDCFTFPRMSYRWNHPPGSLFRLVAVHSGVFHVFSRPDGFLVLNTTPLSGGPQCVSPFTCWRTPRLFPGFGKHGESWQKHLCLQHDFRMPLWTTYETSETEEVENHVTSLVCGV